MANNFKQISRTATYVAVLFTLMLTKKIKKGIITVSDEYTQNIEERSKAV